MPDSCWIFSAPRRAFLFIYILVVSTFQSLVTPNPSVSPLKTLPSLICGRLGSLSRKSTLGGHVGRTRLKCWDDTFHQSWDVCFTISYKTSDAEWLQKKSWFQCRKASNCNKQPSAPLPLGQSSPTKILIGHRFAWYPGKSARDCVALITYLLVLLQWS